MTSALRSVLRYAENAVNNNHAKLTALGWGGPAPRTPLQVPGQPRSLERSPPRRRLALSRQEGTDRRRQTGGDWETVGMAIATEATHNNQERGKEWEYRVIAANTAGEGESSNAVAAVLCWILLKRLS